jgi:Predicted nucleotidyltransferases
MDEAIDDPVMQTLLIELRRSLGTTLSEVWLFGSRARGEAQEGSDYDVLIVADEASAETKALVLDAEWACMEAHNALVSCIVYTRETWERRKDTPLGWNILREGRRAA